MRSAPQAQSVSPLRAGSTLSVSPTPAGSFRTRGVRSRALSGACLGLALLLAAPALAAPTRPQGTPSDTGLFAPVAAQYRARLGRLAALARGPVTPARIRLLLATGRVDEAGRLLPRLRGEAREVELVRARTLLVLQDFAAAAPLCQRIAARAEPTDEERDLVLAWLFAHDDAARVDTLTRDVLSAGTAAGPRLPELLAAGRLAHSLMSYARAESCYERALAISEATLREDAPGARRYLEAARDTSLIGLAQVRNARREWDAAFDAARRALAADASADAMTTLAQALLRVGRTDEAISAAEWATLLGPYGEMAHYMRGNGYTVRRNYTQLAAACPRAFADAAGQRALAVADRLLAAGDRAGARTAYEAVHRAHPGWVDVLARLASLDFEQGRFGRARDLCFAALRICPEYGRAHAILAKALQFQRFAVDVHRAGYEARFAAAPMPDVPGIERFVVNWRSLAPRARKRVALSIAPWRRFVPVLLEAGSDFYIKPMYMRLSEVPGQETLKDQRIEYDSRLWDDVRGSGGYHTVTGIEDVEATIFDRYNTVLHELTHQVHAVLTRDEARAILDLYRATKARDEATHDAFLSRYSAVAVEEYLAEGANALGSVDRDAYDPRPEVRSRLERKDPALRGLVERLMSITDMDPYYAVAYVRAGDDRVSRGAVDSAVVYYEKALARSPHEETGLNSLTRALDLANRGPQMLAAADTALAAQPSSGAVVAEAAEAWWHGGRGLDSALALTARARAGVTDAERWVVDLERSHLAWTAGDAATALAAADSVLARQADSPDGLRERAASLALAARWDEAFTEYDKAVRQRTGIADLRCDYARDLLRAGRPGPAQRQLDEARLLDPENPTAEALRGWLVLAGGDAATAQIHARQALDWGPWCDLARIVLGLAQKSAGDDAAAESTWAPVRARLAKDEPPAFVYREKISTWEAVHELPAVERALLR
jgi:tetratricopeptide (TPR) repeat protein